MRCKGAIRTLVPACVFVVAAVLAAPASAATLDSIGFSADPTEDEPVSVTISGTTEPGRTLFAYRRTGAASCAASAYAEYVNNNAQTLIGEYIGGESLPGGSFSRVYEFTPTAAGSYRVCAYVATSSTTVPSASGAGTVPVRLPAATVDSVTVSDDPTEEEPVAITIAGSSEADRTLYAYRRTSSAPCAGSAYAEYVNNNAQTLIGEYIGGEAVAAGSFSRTYEFTPPTAGSYRVCAYIAESSTVTPLATGGRTVPVRLPQATIEPLQISADPTEEEPVSVTIAGTSEADRLLYVYRRTGSAACAASAYAEYVNNNAQTLIGDYVGGEAVAAGSFSRAYQFTPDAAATYRICAYVAETSTSVPLASRSGDASVRLPTATIDPVTVSADPTKRMPVTLTLTGATEANRTLYVYRRTGSAACGGSAYAEYVNNNAQTLIGEYVGGEAIGTGTFQRTYQFTPGEAGTFRICAYVAESATVPAVGSHAQDVTVRAPHASVAIAGGAPRYLKDQRLTMTASGEAEQPALLSYSVNAGDVACGSGSPYGVSSRVPVGPGGFNVPVTGSFDGRSVHTICLFMFDAGDGSALTVHRELAHKQALELPSAREVSVGANRKPVFRWRTGASGGDTLVLTEMGEPLVQITEAGALTPDEARSQRLDDADDYYDDEDADEPESAQPDSELARIVRRPDGISEVAFGTALPPGRYGWQVIRTRDAGETAAGPVEALRVAGPPLTTLRVSAKGHRGGSSRRPGHTTIKIKTTPFARVKLTLRRSGRERNIFITWGDQRTATQRVDWSCGRPGAYRYVVEARDEQGKTLRRTGRFAAASATRCRTMRRAEQLARQRRRAVARKRAREQARREAAAERRRVGRFIDNCYAAGGTPVKVRFADGPDIMCRAPWGGFLLVPM